MSIMSILTTYSAREVSSNIVVLPLSWWIVMGAPLGVLVLVSPSGLVLWGLIPALTRVVVIHVLSFLLGIVRWMSWVGCIQLLETLVLLHNIGLNKIYPHMWMWGSHGLWGTRKGEVWIFWWYRSIRYIGRHSAFTSTVSCC